ncbi:MAG: glycosyltransferase family 2 protein [Deltaproteobacteria bacterium]|nr:glycosyltransferase family 2 protein [Deltaproteobacteria bacterium]
MADVAVLIPAFNCERTIGEVVRGAGRFVAAVLVVDDGSSDETAARARAGGAEVVQHSTNRGKGAALQTGLQLLARGGVTHVLTMDGDGQHLAEEIPALLQASQAEPRALVIGARRIAAGTVPGLRLFGNRFANRWVEIACGQALPDTQSGLRIYPLPAALALGARAGHFAFETEVLIRAVRAGIPIRSLPVAVYYPPPEQRLSHYRPFLDTVRIIFTVVGLILHRR